jgi:hypothetical protein
MQALADEACTLGQRIADGDAAGITQRETTITETALLNLHKRLGPRLKIKPLTQNEEGEQGADWVRCVGNKRGWFSFYVQAKKLKSSGYDIGYRTSSAKPRQVDRLLTTSAIAGVDTRVRALQSCKYQVDVQR